MIRFIPDSPHFAHAYLPVELPPVGIDEAVRRQDASLRLRKNQLLSRWEVWFLKEGHHHVDFYRLTPEEISERSRFWFAIQDRETGEALPLKQEELLSAIWVADWWRRNGARTQDVENALAAQDRYRIQGPTDEAVQQLKDFIIDHKNQLYPLKDLHSMEHMKLIRRGL